MSHDHTHSHSLTLKMLYRRNKENKKTVSNISGEEIIARSEIREKEKEKEGK